MTIIMTILWYNLKIILAHSTPYPSDCCFSLSLSKITDLHRFAFIMASFSNVVVYFGLIIIAAFKFTFV